MPYYTWLRSFFFWIPYKLLFLFDFPIVSLLFRFLIRILVTPLSSPFLPLASLPILTPLPPEVEPLRFFG